MPAYVHVHTYNTHTHTHIALTLTIGNRGRGLRSAGGIPVRAGQLDGTETAVTLVGYLAAIVRMLAVTAVRRLLCVHRHHHRGGGILAETLDGRLFLLARRGTTTTARVLAAFVVVDGRLVLGRVVPLDGTACHATLHHVSLGELARHFETAALLDKDARQTDPLESRSLEDVTRAFDLFLVRAVQERRIRAPRTFRKLPRTRKRPRDNVTRRKLLERVRRVREKITHHKMQFDLIRALRGTRQRLRESETLPSAFDIHRLDVSLSRLESGRLLPPPPSPPKLALSLYHFAAIGESCDLKEILKIRQRERGIDQCHSRCE